MEIVEDEGVDEEVSPGQEGLEVGMEGEVGEIEEDVGTNESVSVPDRLLEHPHV